MMKMSCLQTGAVCVLLFTGGGRAAAQDAPAPGWYNTSELTAVWTAGNSPASTFGLKDELRHLWENATFKLEAGAIRTASTTLTRSARGTTSAFNVTETESTKVTAESYFLRGRLDRNLSAVMFLFGGAGWNRNTFAGIRGRYAFVAGAGNAWVNRDDAVFKTDYGVTYTIQDDVVDDPSKADSFAGLRLSAELKRQLTASTKYDSNLIVDENLDDTEDLRADWVNSIAVSISQGLALKTGIQLLYDNKPSLADVPLLTTGGNPTGSTVPVTLDKLDSIFTVALVINF